MKRRILIGLMVVIVVSVGIIAGRADAGIERRSSMPPVTVVSLVTDYGTDGSILGRYRKVRRQYADGSWKTHMDNPWNGQTYESSGRVDPKKVPTAGDFANRATALGRPVDYVLGYQVFVQKEARYEVWYCPQLGTILKEVFYNKDGTLADVTEAIEIVQGPPA
jgi:hypothetical protein